MKRWKVALVSAGLLGCFFTVVETAKAEEGVWGMLSKLSWYSHNPCRETCLFHRPAMLTDVDFLLEYQIFFY